MRISELYIGKKVAFAALFDRATNRIAIRVGYITDINAQLSTVGITENGLALTVPIHKLSEIIEEKP